MPAPVNPQLPIHPDPPEPWTWTSPCGQPLKVGWSCQKPNKPDPDHAVAVVLIHGFGACKEHWRYNMPVLANAANTYAIDLIGFGMSSQPRALLGDDFSDNDAVEGDSLCYSFDLWAAQVVAFCQQVVQQPVVLVGNSIGGVVALRAAQLLQEQSQSVSCEGVVLIDCAQRLMDDKQLATQPAWMAWIRPLLKTLVSQRWLSTALFRNAARPALIRSVLHQAYPSGSNVDDDLVSLLFKPSQRPGAPEAFRGFINLFNDHLAPSLLESLSLPVHMIWGEADPWEPVGEAKNWEQQFDCIQSLLVIPHAGHCPHDESPSEVNERLLLILNQQAT